MVSVSFAQVFMKRPTQEDVARIAGVSRAAVSYVINGRDIGTSAISEETRLRILDAARQLGYEPDSAAQSLRSQLTHTVGLLIPDMFNPHYWQITRGVEDALHTRGYDLLLMSTSHSPEREHAALRSVLRRRVDGLILVLHFFDQEKQEIQTILQRKCPVVLLGAQSNELDTVNPEDQPGTRELLNRLLALGHRKIGLVYGVATKGLGSTRLELYREFMAEHFGGSGDGWIEFGGASIEDGYHATRSLLDRASGLTAIVVINDLLATGAMHAIYERGLRIPEDISIASFDDTDASPYLNPALTTVKTYGEDMGSNAVRLLFERLDNPDRPCQHINVTGTLISRSSIGPALPA
jgi:LacI family transcriptional regulator